MDTKEQEKKIKPDIVFPTIVVSVNFPDCAKVNEGLIKLARKMQEQDCKAKLNHNHSGKNSWQSMREIHKIEDPAMKEWVESLNPLLNDLAEEMNRTLEAYAEYYYKIFIQEWIQTKDKKKK